MEKAKTFTRRLPAKLDDHELALMGKKLADLMREAGRVEDAKKAAVADFKSQLDTLETHAKDIAEQLRTGEVSRDVPCVEEVDVFRACFRVYRTDVDPRQLIEQRPMTASELRHHRQLSLVDGDGKGPAPKAADAPPAEELKPIPLGSLLGEGHAECKKPDLQVKPFHFGAFAVVCLACGANQSVNLEALARVDRAQLEQAWCPAELVQALHLKVTPPAPEGPTQEALRGLMPEEHRKNCTNGTITLGDMDEETSRRWLRCSCGASHLVLPKAIEKAAREGAPAPAAGVLTSVEPQDAQGTLPAGGSLTPASDVAERAALEEQVKKARKPRGAAKPPKEPKPPKAKGARKRHDDAGEAPEA